MHRLVSACVVCMQQSQIFSPLTITQASQGNLFSRSPEINRPRKSSNPIIPIGQRPIALLDSSKSINIKSNSTAATIYLMSTALQNCTINCLYSVLPGKLEDIMLIALIYWYKSYVLFHCHNIDHSNNNNR